MADCYGNMLVEKGEKEQKKRLAVPPIHELTTGSEKGMRDRDTQYKMRTENEKQEKIKKKKRENVRESKKKKKVRPPREPGSMARRTDTEAQSKQNTHGFNEPSLVDSKLRMYSSSSQSRYRYYDCCIYTRNSSRGHSSRTTFQGC